MDGTILVSSMIYANKYDLVQELIGTSDDNSGGYEEIHDKENSSKSPPL